MQRLNEYGLYVKSKKCSFDQRQVEFSGYIVSSDGIAMDPTKVQTVLDRQIPQTLRDEKFVFGVRIFLSQVHQRLFKGHIALPQLTQKNRPCVWSTNTNSAFEAIKQAFTVYIQLFVNFERKEEVQPKPNCALRGFLKPFSVKACEWKHYYS